jgi:hypothetical protein
MAYAPDSSTDVLERTPAALKALLGRPARPWVRGPASPDAFSAFDAGRLVEGEERGRTRDLHAC